MLRWLVFSLFLALPAMAEDRCQSVSFRQAFGDWRPISYLLTAVTYRKECGVFGASDLAAMRTVLPVESCPSDSPLMKSFSYRLNAPLTETNSHPGIAILRRGAPQSLARFCRMAEAMPWPAGGAADLIKKPDQEPQLQAYQAFWAHLDAMQGELTRMVTEATP